VEAGATVIRVRSCHDDADAATVGLPIRARSNAGGSLAGAGGTDRAAVTTVVRVACQVGAIATAVRLPRGTGSGCRRSLATAAVGGKGVGPVVDLLAIIGPIAIAIRIIGIGAVDVRLIVVKEAVPVAVGTLLLGRLCRCDPVFGEQAAEQAYRQETQG